MKSDKYETRTQIMKNEMEKLGQAASMTQAASILGIDKIDCQMAKNAGCQAFKASGRVDMDALSEWLARDQIRQAVERISAAYEKLRFLYYGGKPVHESLAIGKDYLSYFTNGLNAFWILFNREEASRDGFTLPPVLPKEPDGE
jgi:hypothetical protein